MRGLHRKWSKNKFFFANCQIDFPAKIVDELSKLGNKDLEIPPCRLHPNLLHFVPQTSLNRKRYTKSKEKPTKLEMGCIFPTLYPLSTDMDFLFRPLKIRIDLCL